MLVKFIESLYYILGSFESNNTILISKQTKHSIMMVCYYYTRTNYYNKYIDPALCNLYRK